MPFDAYTYQRNKLRVIMFQGELKKIKHYPRQQQIRRMSRMLWEWDPYKKMTAATFKPRCSRSRLSTFNTQELYELMVDVYNYKKGKQ